MNALKVKLLFARTVSDCPVRLYAINLSSDIQTTINRNKDGFLLGVRIKDSTIKLIST